MKPANIAKNLKQVAVDPFETIKDQVIKPIAGEGWREVRPFLNPLLGPRPQEMAKEDLKRARESLELEEKTAEDDTNSESLAEKVAVTIRENYRTQEVKSNNEKTSSMETEFVALQEEVAKLAEAAGVDAKAHLETKPQKVSILDIKRLTLIVKELTAKVEESKNAQEMVSQRSNAKRTTGMQAWVSGKQMKIHEQGTLQLQG